MAEGILESALQGYCREFGTILYLLIDGVGTVRDSNRFTRELVGKEILGEPYRDVLIDFSDTLSPFEMALKDQGPHLVNVMTASGLPETFYCRFQALGEQVLVLGSEDVSEQEALRHEVIVLNQEFSNLARQLQKANSELTRLNQLKNQFLGMAAHDLRKPLGVVMTYSEILLDEMGEHLTEEYRGFLSAIVGAGDFMRQLIDNFLDTALIESGRLQLNPVKTSLPEIVGQALEMVRFSARKKGIEIRVRQDPKIPPLFADAPKMEQVIINLVSNAIEHSYPGSVVEIETGLKSEAFAFIEVRDSGTGIAEEDLRELFSSYGKGRGRKTAGERSIGLGLAIARKLVEQHAGSISVQSKPEKGSTFSVSIPLAARELE